MEALFGTEIPLPKRREHKLKDAEIIRLIRLRDVRGVEKLIDKYGAYVASVVRRTALPALSESDVEELTADVFTAAWQAPYRLPEEKLRQYLSVVARNKAVSRLRKTRHILPLEDVIAVDDSFEDEASRLTIADELKSALLLLESSDRDILISAYYDCRKTAEIAAKLGISESAAKTRLCRARGRLRKILTEKGFTYED